MKLWLAKILITIENRCDKLATQSGLRWRQVGDDDDRLNPPITVMIPTTKKVLLFQQQTASFTSLFLERILEKMYSWNELSHSESVPDREKSSFVEP